MNQKLKLIVLAIAAIMIITPMITLQGAKAASWQTVNNDYHLNSSSAWSPSIWNNGIGWWQYIIPYLSYAQTQRDMTGTSTWGNTEFVQGYKPIWGNNPYGAPFNPVLMTDTIQVSATAERTGNLYTAGAANIYIDLWCMFSGQVGNGGPGGTGLQHMEIIIYLGEYGQSKECPSGNTYSTRVADDGAGGHHWYFAGYRVPSDIGTSYASNTINVNSIISREASKYGITTNDLANAAICGLTFGVEVSNANLAANWDSVALQHYV